MVTYCFNCFLFLQIYLLIFRTLLPPCSSFSRFQDLSPLHHTETEAYKLTLTHAGSHVTSLGNSDKMNAHTSELDPYEPSRPRFFFCKHKLTWVFFRRENKVFLQGFVYGRADDKKRLSINTCYELRSQMVLYFFDLTEFTPVTKKYFFC